MRQPVKSFKSKQFVIWSSVLALFLIYVAVIHQVARPDRRSTNNPASTRVESIPQKLSNERPFARPFPMKTRRYVARVQGANARAGSADQNADLSGSPVEVILDPVPPPDSGEARVWLFSIAGDDTETSEPAPQLYQSGRSASVADGRADFRSVAAGWHKVAGAIGNAYAESRPFLVPKDTVLTSTVRLAWNVTGTVHGRVVDRDTKQPVGGASVHAEMAAAPPVRVLPKATMTGEDGLFSFEGLPSGDITVSAEEKPFPAARTSVSVPDDSAKFVELQLFRRFTGLQGRVLVDDIPVSGALVIAGHAEASGGDRPEGAVRTNADGLYVLGGLSPGACDVTVEAPFGAEEQLLTRNFTVQISDTTQTRDLVMHQPVRIEGALRVRSELLDRPNEDRKIFFFSRDPNGEVTAADVSSTGSFVTQLNPGIYSVQFADRSDQQIRIPKSDRPIRVFLNF